MIKIICDRCGADITSKEEVGYIEMRYRNTENGAICSGTLGTNEFENNHYCQSCMEQIRKYITSDLMAPTKEESKPKTEVKVSSGKRKRLDYGKINALHEAGWSNGNIAEEMGMSKQSVQVAISKIRTHPELLQSMQSKKEKTDDFI